MSFQPVLPFSGSTGWTFLKRTETAQMDSFVRRPEILRDEAYFRDSIAGIRSAEALVSDRRLMRISLEAFGLEADVASRAFVRKVLEGGSESGESLANRLTDPRYAAFAKAFGFGDKTGARTSLSTFPNEIMARWKERRFETAVGTVDNGMRLAMNARRELATIATGGGSERAKWLKVMGSIPLRTVVQGALGLPQSFASVDLDRQVSLLQRRMDSALGSETVSQLSDPQKLDSLIRRFLVSAEIGKGPLNSPALTLFQSGSLLRRL